MIAKLLRTIDNGDHFGREIVAAALLGVLGLAALLCSLALIVGLFMWWWPAGAAVVAAVIVAAYRFATKEA